MAEINSDYIGVVRQKSNGLGLEYVQVDIPKRFGNLIAELNDMNENSNRTVLDLQDYFTRNIPETGNPNYFDFCMPHYYCSSFIKGASYPDMITYNEYQDILRKHHSIMEEILVSRHGQRTPDNDLIIKEELEKSVKDKKESLKSDFCTKAIRYITAYQYYLTLKELNSNSGNKMFSSENIGWTVYNYEINDDLVFTVRSNFGYGQSSRFYVNLKYKGVDLLPYSDIVNYYYANMQDFIQYTRSYGLMRSSWDICLSFVVDTANEAISNESEFIKKWIMNEVDEMVSGLSRLEANPTAFYNTISCTQRDLHNLITVRNIIPSEIKSYKIYPTETVVAYQAEKISGALLLLEKLSALKVIYPEIEASIERIKNMNQRLLPNFKTTFQAINNEVNVRNKAIVGLKKQHEELNVRKKQHEEDIERIIQEEQKKDKGLPSYTIRNNYRSEHTDYSNLLVRIDKLEMDINEREHDINERRRFASRISECINRIEMYVTNAA